LNKQEKLVLATAYLNKSYKNYHLKKSYNISNLHLKDIFKYINHHIQQKTQEIYGYNLIRIFNHYYDQKINILSSNTKLLESLNYHNVLKRGYTIVRDEQNRV